MFPITPEISTKAYTVYKALKSSPIEWLSHNPEANRLFDTINHINAHDHTALPYLRTECIRLCESIDPNGEYPTESVCRCDADTVCVCEEPLSLVESLDLVAEMLTRS